MEKNSLSGIADAQAEVVKQTASLIPFVFKAGVVLTIVYIGYTKYSNRFVKRSEISKYGIANVTLAEAQSRAAAIGGAISMFGNSFDTVADNLQGLNYNGFIRVYNAFGKQRGTLLTYVNGGLDLEDWVRNQFTVYEVKQLSLLLNNAFFK